MTRYLTVPTQLFGCAAALAVVLSASGQLLGQAGLRESLERLDRNQDGEIEPDEITPLARPYLERITRARRMSLDRANDIDKLQEAARIYYALQNGARGEEVDPEPESTVKRFGRDWNETLVPEFGLAEIKYPYTQADLDQANRTLRRSDRNRDGYIDRAEAREAEWTHRNPFEMDLNEDGRLSRLELCQRYARRRLLSRASGELMKKAWRTGSGIRPSEPERSERRDDSSYWRRGGTRYWLTATVLGRFDTNKNGRLEASEAQSLGIPLSQMDANRDRELSREELHAFLSEMQDALGDVSEGLPGWFFELDANRDGQVAMAEFATEWTDEKLQEFLSLDTNGDGLLTSSEVVQSKAMVGGAYTNEDAQMLPPRKTIISEIEVDEDYLIGDLDVQLSITHTHIAWLDAYLTGPDGQRIELFTEIGGEGDHFDQTVFDDQSRYPIVKARPPYKGSFMPEAQVKRQPSLSSFNGTNIQGVWQLVIRGTRNERFGMLHSWGLYVKPQGDMLDNAMTTLPEEGSESTESPSADSQSGGQQPPAASEQSRGGEGTRESDQEAKGDDASKYTLYGTQLIKRADKNGDGVLTIDEYTEEDKSQFDATDANGDGQIDAAEVGAAIMRLKGS